MPKKTKARSSTKPTPRTRKPTPRTRPAKKRATQRTERPKTRRPPKKRTRSPKVQLAPKPSDMKRPVPGEPVRIQPPPGLVRGRHDPSLEKTAAPRIGESARGSTGDDERRQTREVPERRRAVDRAASDANRWVHRQPNERRGNAWQARGHSTMRGR
jgi:hypothetical protein